MLIELLRLTNDIVLRLLRECVGREWFSWTGFVDGTGILFDEANSMEQSNIGSIWLVVASFVDQSPRF